MNASTYRAPCQEVPEPVDNIAANGGGMQKASGEASVVESSYDLTPRTPMVFLVRHEVRPRQGIWGMSSVKNGYRPHERCKYLLLRINAGNGIGAARNASAVSNITVTFLPRAAKYAAALGDKLAWGAGKENKRLTLEQICRPRR